MTVNPKKVPPNGRFWQGRVVTNLMEVNSEHHQSEETITGHHLLSSTATCRDKSLLTPAFGLGGKV